MPEFHSEPYLYLPTVTHKSALVAWGAFYFRVTGRGVWKLVDDSDLKYIHPPRKDRDKALVQTGRQYANGFCTHPDPTTAVRSLTFAAIGDFGVGVKTDSLNRRQQQIADALRYAFDTQDVRLVITTGDNIYAGSKLFGLPIGATGDEDDDWF